MAMNKPLEVKISEKYYIEKGQGIDQLLAVSLDDHIRLHEFPSFIQLKGEVILEGEFAKEPGIRNLGERKDFPQRKYMQSIELLEDGIAYFRQIIPVDITIPKSSVRDIEDIQVSIHHFDYSIPTPHIFILFATLCVTGIVKEEEEETRAQSDAVLEEVIIEEKPVEETPTVVEDVAEELAEELAAEELPIEEVLQPEVESIVNVERLDEKIDNETIDEVPYVVHKNVAEDSDEGMVVDDEVDSSFSEAEVVEGEVREVHESFLDELFGADRVAQVTKYVVQEEDSLASVAERFAVPVGELSRVNREVVDDFRVGVVLTIYR